MKDFHLYLTHTKPPPLRLIAALIRLEKNIMRRQVLKVCIKASKVV